MWPFASISTSLSACFTYIYAHSGRLAEVDTDVCRAMVFHVLVEQKQNAGCEVNRQPSHLCLSVSQSIILLTPHEMLLMV